MTYDTKFKFHFMYKYYYATTLVLLKNYFYTKKILL